MERDPIADTRDVAYTRRLSAESGRRWKQLLDVQRPYRRKLQRLDLGFVLDVGCGIGRNLANLHGRGVGVDHNEASVQTCVTRGFRAFTPAAFQQSSYAVPGSFDSMLLAHVAEHMTHDEAVALVRTYLPSVRPGGRVVVICPQEAGYATDTTHVRFVDEAGLRALVRALDLEPVALTSFPFPRWFGRLFAYNEFVAVARVPDTPGA